MDAVGRCASVARREAVESVMSERGAPLATGRRGAVAARAAQERTQAHLFSDDLPDWGRVGRSVSVARCHAGPRIQ